MKQYRSSDDIQIYFLQVTEEIYTQLTVKSLQMTYSLTIKCRWQLLILHTLDSASFLHFKSHLNLLCCFHEHKRY